MTLTDKKQHILNCINKLDNRGAVCLDYDNLEGIEDYEVKEIIQTISNDGYISNLESGNFQSCFTKESLKLNSFCEYGGYTQEEKDNKPKKTYWKTATLTLGILAILIPSIQTVYYNNLSTQNKTLEIKINSLSVELQTQKELHKSFVDSIYSISTLKDTLNIP
jgi:hypothetical protein